MFNKGAATDAIGTLFTEYTDQHDALGKVLAASFLLLVESLYG